MKKLLETYKGQIHFVVKNYPYRYRDFSRMAAEAFLIAADQGKGWEMHALLLEKSPRLERKNLLKYAEMLELDMKSFIADLDAKKHDAIIQREHDLALALDLYNTPTFFINGRKVVGDRPYEYLKKIIDEELENAKK